MNHTIRLHQRVCRSYIKRTGVDFVNTSCPEHIAILKKMKLRFRFDNSGYRAKTKRWYS